MSAVPEELVDAVATVICLGGRATLNDCPSAEQHRDQARAAIAAVLAFEQTCPECEGTGLESFGGPDVTDSFTDDCSACGGSGRLGPRYVDVTELEQVGWAYDGRLFENEQLHVESEPVFRLPGKATT